MLCFLNKAARRSQKNPMKKKYSADLHSKYSRHGGSNAKSGYCTLKVTVPLVQDLQGLLRLLRVRKKMLVLR